MYKKIKKKKRKRKVPALHSSHPKTQLREPIELDAITHISPDDDLFRGCCCCCCCWFWCYAINMFACILLHLHLTSWPQLENTKVNPYSIDQSFVDTLLSHSNDSLVFSRFQLKANETKDSLRFKRFFQIDNSFLIVWYKKLGFYDD